MTAQSADQALAGLPLPPVPPPPPPPSGRPRRFVFQRPKLDNIEDVKSYGPGGHYPVNLGDIIGHKFKILHKLGNGGFALVWLAQQLHQVRNVALKILKADAPDREVGVLEHLKNTPANTVITNLHEAFTIQSPNGSHLCLVLDLGGPSLSRISLYCERPPLQFLRSAAGKLAEGVAALHSAGVCHGDLTHSNVLFQVVGLQSWTEEEIYRHLGLPKTAPLLLLDGTPAPAFAPSHIVDALNYSQLSMTYLSSNVLMTDFGQAFFKDDAPKGLGTSASYSAPELLFGYQPSCAVDVWALGCLIFEMHTFRVLAPAFFGSDEEALGMAIETIGALPAEWQGSFYDKKNPLDDEGPDQKHRWFDNWIKRTRTLESQLREHIPELTQRQHDTLLQLLESILVFEPRHRLVATEVAKHPWFACE